MIALVALVVGTAAVVAGRTGDAPGVLLLGVLVVLLAVAWYDRRTRPGLVALVGVGGIAAGLADDAPGAVLLGLVLVGGSAVANGLRTRRRLA